MRLTPNNPTARASRAIRAFSQVAFAVLGLAAVSAKAETRVTLVENGAGCSVIILAEGASRNTALAAEELQRCIERMSGARLPIVPDPGTNATRARVWIGPHPDLPAHAPGLDLTLDQPEEILLAAVGANDLVIAGCDQPGSGTANAVYTFIQDRLEVRWLWPGELGEDIPRQATIAFAPFVHRYRCPLRQRNYRHLPANQDGSARAEALRRWMRRQRMGHGHNSFSMSAGHAFTDWWERYGQDNPEYFALQPDGTRGPYAPDKPDGVKLCISNPEVHARWLDNAAETVRKKCGPMVLSASPNDWANMGTCVCEQCRAWDHPGGRKVNLRWAGGVAREQVALTDRYVQFWNALARGLKARFPEQQLLVGAWAYQEYASPPIGVKLEDNIVIGFVDGYPEAYGGFFAFPADLREQDREIWRGWAGQAKYMVWRPNLGHTVTAGLGLPQLAMQRSAEDFRFLTAHNLVGLDIDSVRDFWSTQGLQQYMIAQLAWDSHVDEKALVSDYCRRGFGPAAEELEAYFRHVERLFYRYVEQAGRLNRIAQYQQFVDVYTPEALAQAASFLNAAETAVASGDEIYRRRVAFVRQGLAYVEALMEAYGVMQRLRAGPDDIVAAIREANQAAAGVDGLVKAGEADFALTANRSRSLARDYFGPPNEDYQSLLAVDDLLGSYATPWLPTPRQWRFKLDPDNIGLNEHWEKGTLDWQGLRVHHPYSWSETFDTDPGLSKRLKTYAGIGWYSTNVKVPAVMKDRAIWLYFGGVSDSCTVFVNGSLAGERKAESPDDWRRPFTIRIDPQVDWDAPVQNLTVRVDRQAGSTGPGGIYRPPWIIPAAPRPDTIASQHRVDIAERIWEHFGMLLASQ